MKVRVNGYNVLLEHSGLNELLTRIFTLTFSTTRKYENVYVRTKKNKTTKSFLEALKFRGIS